MFSFFKKKSLNLIAPISGRTVNLSEVPDPVFAEKMVGDGVAIIPTGDIVVAPCDGTLSLIMDSKHAFAMTLSNGVEILVHVGLETVALKGSGFEVLAEVGQTLKAGTPILKLDKKILEEAGVNLITPVLIANPDILTEINPIVNKEVTSSKDVIIEYKL